MWTHELTVGEAETAVSHQTSSTFSYFSASLQLHGDMSPVLTTSGLKHRKISTKASVSAAAMTSEVVSQV